MQMASGRKPGTADGCYTLPGGDGIVCRAGNGFAVPVKGFDSVMMVNLDIVTVYVVIAGFGHGTVIGHNDRSTGRFCYISSVVVGRIPCYGVSPFAESVGYRPNARHEFCFQRVFRLG